MEPAFKISVESSKNSGAEEGFYSSLISKSNHVKSKEISVHIPKHEGKFPNIFNSTPGIITTHAYVTTIGATPSFGSFYVTQGHQGNAWFTLDYPSYTFDPTSNVLYRLSTPTLLGPTLTWSVGNVIKIGTTATAFSVQQLQKRSERYFKAAELLRQWREEKSDYDKNVWPLLEKELKDGRTRLRE